MGKVAGNVAGKVAFTASWADDDDDEDDDDDDDGNIGDDDEDVDDDDDDAIVEPLRISPVSSLELEEALESATLNVAIVELLRFSPAPRTPFLNLGQVKKNS